MKTNQYDVVLKALKDLLEWAECQCGLFGNEEAYGCDDARELQAARMLIMGTHWRI